MNLTNLSLLERARTGSSTDWDRLVALYEPLIFGWLQRQGLPYHAAEELTQDVLLTVFRELGSFEHPGRPGGFRAWLRTITVNRGRAYWRGEKLRPTAVGGSEFHSVLEQLEDPQSELSRQWEHEHDRHVISRLLELLAGEFTPSTLCAFRRQVFDGTPAETVAAELDLSVGAVYVAKSRVLARLRKEAEGILADDSFP
jgi:RNA polymerase sigma-70 factor (ECF subfamily)